MSNTPTTDEDYLKRHIALTADRLCYEQGYVELDTRGYADVINTQFNSQIDVIKRQVAQKMENLWQDPTAKAGIIEMMKQRDSDYAALEEKKGNERDEYRAGLMAKYGVGTRRGPGK